MATTSLLVLTLLLGVGFVNGYPAKDGHKGDQLIFLATPHTVKTGLTRTVNMHCSLSEKISITHVTNIDITYGPGHDYVASISADHGAEAYMTQGNLTATGDMSGRGRFDLTWDAPDDMKMGAYYCEVTARSPQGRRVRFRSEVKMSSAVPSIHDLLERINANEKDSDEAEKKLVACTSQRAAFMVVMDKQLKFSSSNPIIYDKVLLDTDSGYNAGTGEFVVKSPGVYSISANIVSGANKQNCIQLQVNSVAITSTITYDTNTSETGSMSAAVALKKNDNVKVVKKCSSDMFFKDSGQLIHQANTFSGVLVSPDACLA